MNDRHDLPLGVAGHLARAFIASPLVPLLMLAAFALGALALAFLPREEEPQISVPMVDVHVEAAGLEAADAVELVTKPLELILRGIPDVEHVYTQTHDDRLVATARFFVGTSADDAILRVHEEIRANIHRLPVGIPEPLIVGRGIDDVAILVLTLSPDPSLPQAVLDRWDRASLGDVADELMAELAKTPDVGLTYTTGASPDEIRVQPDPAALALYGVTLEQLALKVRNANRRALLGRVRDDGRARDLVGGQTLTGQPDIGLLVITTRDGRPVYVKDVADIVVAPEASDRRVWQLTAGNDGGLRPLPAVSLAIAKRDGANAVVVAEEVLERLALSQGRLVPEDLRVDVVRNYGETAQAKSDELFSHLVGATLTIIVLIVLFVGWKEGIVTLVIIPATILLTFAASWLMGYTINRVSLFALIFSIGILVDDAIVVVENIARHWCMEPRGDRIRLAIRGVAEVGNPTIIATLTIVTALLPMLFVSGLMGPYMSPIPANASAAMIFSFFVAVVFAPWILVKLDRLRPTREGTDPEAGDGGRMGRIYRAIARPILWRRWTAFLFLGGVGVATAAAVSLFATQHVTVKLLPFDDKSEVQVVVDLPEGSTLEATERVLFALGQALGDLPELESLQAYAGTAAPFTFNGLVRHYYVRSAPEQGDLQVNLAPRDQRARQSHAIALDIRERLRAVPVPEGTALKVVEVPPGPPVLATLLAEVYGPDAETRRAVAEELKAVFASVDFIVDVDDSYGVPTDRLQLAIDQANLDYLGVEEEAVHDTLELLFTGTTVGYSHRGGGTNPIPISLRLDESQRQVTEALLTVPVPARGPAGIETGNVELGDVLAVTTTAASHPVFRKNGVALEMVTAELAGRFEAPIYGMLAVQDAIDAHRWGDLPKPRTKLYGQPLDESVPTLLWDGEWEVTYVTFRDMGAAFGAALLGIYLLIVGQFRSFTLPLVIMTPIPLTLIGIVLGHWALGAPFTATSMIGFISLAGIIVRNSILLTDFIRHEQARGRDLKDALLMAGSVRFLPIFLTAITAMVGAGFILLDPIFQGLAISLLFGLASSTALTLLVIPAIWWVMKGPRAAA